MNRPGWLRHRGGVFVVALLLTGHDRALAAYVKCTFEQAEEAIRIGRTLDTPQKTIAYHRKEWGFALGEAQGEIHTPFEKLVTAGSVSRSPSSFKYDKEYIAECLKNQQRLNKELWISLERRIATPKQRNNLRREDLTVEYQGKIYKPETMILDQMATPYVARDSFYFRIRALKGDSRIKLILNDSITGKKHETVVDLSKMR